MSISLEILTQNKNEDRWACWLRLTDGVDTWDLPATAPGDLDSAGLEAYFQDDADRLWQIAQRKQHSAARRELDGDLEHPTWYVIRRERDRLLSESDWTQLADVPLTNGQKELWGIYRQALRDIPQNFSDPSNVVWPTEPE